LKFGAMPITLILIKLRALIISTCAGLVVFFTDRFRTILKNTVFLSYILDDYQQTPTLFPWAYFFNNGLMALCASINVHRWLYKGVLDMY
jgi:hypothetical protein